MSHIIKKVQPIIEKINQTIGTVLAEESSLINNIAIYNFQSGGKRIRPLLYCLALKALNGKLTQKNLLIASSFEILHMATLLHDDIIDDANTRRGQKASHLVYGPAETVLTGDYLFAKAVTLSSLANNIDCLLIMTNIAQSLSLGELMQLNCRGELNLTEEEYFKIIKNKTAILIASTTQTAGIIMKANKKTIKALETYGENIGLAFQIIDDILDYKSTKSQFGKPVGHDLAEGKITLPFILSRDNLKEKDQNILFELAKKEERTEEDFQKILSFMEKSKALEKAYERAYSFAKKAVHCLEILPNTKAKEQLKDLAYYIVERNF